MRVFLSALLLLAPRAASVAVSLTFTVPAYKGPPAPTPAPTATTTTVTTRPHYFEEDDRVEI